jgi:hypothetical protein
MNEPEPTLGADDCEGHVIVWTYPALDSGRRHRDSPVDDVEGPPEGRNPPIPAAGPEARPTVAKAKRHHWMKLSG